MVCMERTGDGWGERRTLDNDGINQGRGALTTGKEDLIFDLPNKLWSFFFHCEEQEG
jgi:hypothetical protein